MVQIIAVARIPVAGLMSNQATIAAPSGAATAVATRPASREALATRARDSAGTCSASNILCVTLVRLPTNPLHTMASRNIHGLGKHAASSNTVVVVHSWNSHICRGTGIHMARVEPAIPPSPPPATTSPTIQAGWPVEPAMNTMINAWTTRLLIPDVPAKASRNRPFRTTRNPCSASPSSLRRTGARVSGDFTDRTRKNDPTKKTAFSRNGAYMFRVSRRPPSGLPTSDEPWVPNSISANRSAFPGGRESVATTAGSTTASASE